MANTTMTMTTRDDIVNEFNEIFERLSEGRKVSQHVSIIILQLFLSHCVERSEITCFFSLSPSAEKH